MNDEQRQPEQKKTSLKKEVLEWVKSIAIALIAVFLIRTFLFEMIRVDGSSMLETLQDNDRLAVTILDMKFHGPERFDIIICKYPGQEDHYCVKRVIGLPGETIEIRNDGQTYIDGEPILEPYIEHPGGPTYAPYKIPDGHYFVMGDNRADSLDSRYSSVGALEQQRIHGKARLIAWPLNHFSVIQHAWEEQK